MKKFDFCIGNPPYQENYKNAEGTGVNDGSGANSVYDKFIDAAIQTSNVVELIHPARFLFNAGSTKKSWNQKMLSDEHFKVLHFEADSKKIFPSLPVPIPGGIAITYHDKSKTFGAIGTFSQFREMNSLQNSIVLSNCSSIEEIVVSSYSYHFTDALHKDYPDAKSKMSKNHEYDVVSNVFERLPHVFYNEVPDDGEDYISILGIEKTQRTIKYIKRKYITPVKNLDKFKVYLSKANGAAGTIGMPIPAKITGEPYVGKPGLGSTESFLSIGVFDTEEEANNLAKYIKTKFLRATLSLLKVTQDITPSKWKYVPMQNFTTLSDIDWAKTIPEIDQMLFKKYRLPDEVVGFINKYVKEMK